MAHTLHEVSIQLTCDSGEGQDTSASDCAGPFFAASAYDISAALLLLLLLITRLSVSLFGLFNRFAGEATMAVLNQSCSSKGVEVEVGAGCKVLY